MIDFQHLTPAEVERACSEAMERCDAAVAEIVATPAAQRTFRNTFGALESAADIVQKASGTYAFMAYVAEDDALRETARDWEEKLSKYGVELGFREDLYNAVREYAASREASALRGEEQRLLERTLRDYRRNGFELPKEQREQVHGADMLKLVFRGFVPIVSLILFVLGSIFLGLATPSEGAALGALGGIVLAAAHRRLTFSMLRESVFLTVRTASMVGWLLVGSSIFAAVFARLGGAQLIGDFVLGMHLSPEVFFWVIQIIIFVLGWPLEWTEITIIFMPLFLPLLATYHQQYPDHIATDAFFFGIMAALNQQTSFLSPPVAMSAYYLKGVAGKAVTLNEIFSGMYPFMAIQVAGMGVLWLVPWLAYGPATAVFGPSLR